MSAGPGPEQARQALSVAAEQRRRATEAANRVPGWIWPAAFALCSVVWEAGDLGPGNRTIAIMGLMLMLLAAATLLRSAPQVAESLGLGVQLHRSAASARSRALMLAMFALSRPIRQPGSRSPPSRSHPVGHRVPTGEHRVVRIRVRPRQRRTDRPGIVQTGRHPQQGRLRGDTQGICRQGAANLVTRHPARTRPAHAAHPSIAGHRRPDANRWDAPPRTRTYYR